MRTILYFISIVFSFTLMGVSAQTVVKMDMPQQAEKALKVVALFEEEIPEGIPVVLGLMGYDINGGATPYLFEWLLNNEVISTNDIVIFTATKGDQLVLKVTDNNKCRASTSFNLKFATIEPVKNEFIKVYPTVVNDHVCVDLPTDMDGEVLIRIFDLNGKLAISQTILKSQMIPLSLAPGTYFVSVKTADKHKVEKIVVQ
ncbi:MAG: T9SS type A sorting domain-containing protein [Marinilabiliaceae bacterium]|nr:T9SS type A sorting domain-containing protein [Marinilabiliaceae bacterium]